MIPLRDSIKAHRFCFVNYLLLVANIAVFIYQIRLAQAGQLDDFMARFAVVPSLVLADPSLYWHTLISSQFLHGGIMHIVGNMVYLYIFGDNVEDKLGHGGYLFFYILSGIGAAALQIYSSPASVVPMLGASGAIAGVLGAYFVIYPRATVHTLIPLGFFSRIVELPAFIFLGIWFLVQSYSGAATVAVARAAGQELSGGVAWWAHVGGFVVGIAGGLLKRMRFI